MHSAVGQFVFWFMITFSPAPFVGFGTYWLVHGKDATPPAAPAARPNYGPAPERKFSDSPHVFELPAEQPPLEPDVEPVPEPQYEPEGTGAQRRAREIEISPKLKRERDKPDV